MLDQAVDAGDTDRSKFIRAAVREKLSIRKLVRRTAAR